MSDPSVASPALVVVGGPFDGHRIVLELSDDHVVGSGSESQFRFKLINVSALHACFSRSEHGMTVSDLGTSEGTYVNGERADGERVLAEGDRICLGPPGSKQSLKLLVLLPEPSSAPGPPRAGEADELDLGGEGDLVLGPPGQHRDDAQLGGLESPSRPADPELDLAAPRPEPLVLDLESDPKADRDAAPSLSSSPVPPAAASELPPLPSLLSPLPQKPVAPAASADPVALPPLSPEPLPAPVQVPVPPPPAPSRETPSSSSSSSSSTAPPPTPNKRPAPRYTDEMPSIAVERPRERITRPSAMQRTRTPIKRSGVAIGSLRVPRPVVIGTVTALLALSVVAVIRILEVPPPTLLSVVPPRAAPGATVTLIGTSFSTDPKGNTVLFGSQAGEVHSASETRLTVALPAIDASKGPRQVQVSVAKGVLKSGALYMKVLLVPRIVKLEPDVSLPGGEITAHGTGLVEGITLDVAGKAAEVLAASGTTARFKVPDVPVVQGQAVPVQVALAGEVSHPRDLLLARLPLALSIKPEQGYTGQHVVVEGRGFSPIPAENRVTFAGRAALVLEAQPHELTVVVPALAAARKRGVAVVVRAGARKSNSLKFRPLLPTSLIFTPRFHALPSDDGADGERAVVATALGPVLLLAEAAGASSVAHRADKLAGALNGLVEASQKVAFEVRTKPKLAVWVTGAREPLTPVTRDDVAAYAVRGLSAKSLATFWAALLQDYFALFVNKERPTSAIELTENAKVLVRLHGDAARRAGSNDGIHRRSLFPMKPALKAAFAKLALTPPRGTAPDVARSSAPVVGRWQGTIEELAAGRRAVDVTFRLQDKKLTGTLTTRSGGLSMGVPLTSASYGKGRLRFTVVLSGSPRHFSGTLDGSTVTGTIHKSAKTHNQDAVGRFTLRFVR